MKNLLIIICILFLFNIGCAPSQFTPKEVPPIKFEKTPVYVLDLSSIIQPEKPIHIWVDKDFNKVSPDEAQYLLLTKKEYAKYVAQLKIKTTYKELLEYQETLINSNINIINSFKEFIILERIKVDSYKQLWVDSENAYRYEKHSHKVDNTINKGMFSFITIGSFIAALIIAF